jgi:hypothetical protein
MTKLEVPPRHVLSGLESATQSGHEPSPTRMRARKPVTTPLKTKTHFGDVPRRAGRRLGFRVPKVWATEPSLRPWHTPDIGQGARVHASEVCRLCRGH